ncbi:hypothetical protein Taro_024493 [Colocasia esculenta]|uniref:D-fructose-1,6-bisphosphate 1-phosphohydrolase n=1 Tax=Colocasia esculenta TaxID=4460 RepID=A0A843V6Y7_COLES|nr:hypothetical protein [Colocasia esculenta]
MYVFTLDPTYSEFEVKIPKVGKIYTFNEGNYQLWDDNLVGDLSQTLLYDGVYDYPYDKKSKNGKLRLLYDYDHRILDIK